MDWGTCVKGEVATLECIPILFQNIINAALLFAGVVGVIFIIYSGIQYIRSGGDAKQIEGARGTLTYTIVGIVIILLSFFIINTIAAITGVDCIKFIGFDNCK